MRAIVDVHFPDVQKRLVNDAMAVFYELRDVPGLKKRPSTSELLDWIEAADDRRYSSRCALVQGIRETSSHRFMGRF